MRSMLLLILASYAGLHAYFHLKVCRAFALPGAGRGVLAGVLTLLALAPFATHQLEHAGRLLPARLLGCVGYMWVAVVFWFCGMLLLADLWNLAARLLARSLPGVRRFVLEPGSVVTTSSVCVVAALVWGWIEANTLRVREVDIAAAALPAGSRPVRLVMVSDLHLGIHRGRRVAERVARKVAELRPDVLVCTGDLVDSSFDQVGHLARILQALHPPLGKFAVLGNHEYYVGLGEAMAFHRAAGFRMLRQEAVRPAPGLVLAGVDDAAGGYTGQVSLTDERAVLGQVQGPAFVVLLKHEPLAAGGSLNGFDLQLSGHTHGGQIFPFEILLRLWYPLGPGMHRLSSRSLLYVSRGAGTWGPPLRLLAPPEITLFVLKPGG